MATGGSELGSEPMETDMGGRLISPRRSVRRAKDAYFLHSAELTLRARTIPCPSLHMKKLTAFLCALALSPIVALAADKFPDISHDELKKAIGDKKVTLIDVNGSDSYKAGHIPGAIDFETTKDSLASKLPKDKGALVVAYCGNEQCGAYAAAATKAKELGYTNVKHLSAGISGWKQAGEKLEAAK